MQIQIVYGTDHVVDVSASEALSDKEVQDFLVGKLIIHGVDAEGRMLSYSGRNALWVTRSVEPDATDK